eukprot:CAMPEP_0117749532 /NCGR_PEP_ID=MMETSP0947-20121206/9788_1 /TAXON_ID=44440 /ORGANISM="Chattonella subsalsa, Strain CCMP2191" /LENGTH=461 /DNA_ID=CAMNT_0005567445 /DNA_START=14 /DNA_END=1399 /DNA_ORIENTATION=-
MKRSEPRTFHPSKKRASSNELRKNESENSSQPVLTTGERFPKTVVCMRWLFQNWDVLSKDRFELRENNLGEIGVFALKQIEKNQVVVEVPIKKILRSTTLPSKIQSQLEQLMNTDPKIKEIANHHTLKNFPLWIALLEAKNQEDHNFQTYAASLPHQSIDLLSWDEELCNKHLNGTNAHSSSINLFSNLRYLYEHLTELSSFCTFGELIWARGMCVSRSFPAHFIHTEADEFEPCLVPFIDLLNHRKGAKIKLQKIENSLAFITAEKIEKGQEICNNYGDDKSNETLLWSYGFCVPENESDVFSFSIGVPRTSLQFAKISKGLLNIIEIESTIKEPGSDLKIGPLHIKRISKGGVPPNLLQMMAIISAEEEDLPNPEDVENEFEVEIAPEDISSLKNLLESKMAALHGMLQQGSQNSEGAEYYSGLYKQGLIVVLSECIQQLHELLEQFLDPQDSGEDQMP